MLDTLRLATKLETAEIMTNDTKRTYHTIRSIKASLVPGDDLREATTEILCSDGMVLPAGTLFRPIAGGRDNIANKDYRDISVISVPNSGKP